MRNLHKICFVTQKYKFIFPGSVDSHIPASQIQSESLLPSLVSHQTVISTESPTTQQKAPTNTQKTSGASKTATTPQQKAGQKRGHSTTPKEKPARKKVSKKPKVSAQHNFTASLGTHRSGNLHGQRFSAPLQGKVSIAGNTATLQRLSSGTFVLSGATGGQVKLQNGNNIVYLQQLTSSGGTTQVIQTPLIANANGTFSTLSLATSSISNIVTTASMGVAPTTTTTASATATGLVLSSAMDTLKSSQISNLVTTSTIARPSSVEAPYTASVLMQQTLKKRETPPATTSKSKQTVPPISVANGEPSEALPNLPSTLANLILSLPSVTTSGFSAEANAQAQSILQRLSEEDIRTLVTVLAKSTPNSPASLSPAMTPDLGRSPIQSPRTPSSPSLLSEHFLSTTTTGGDNRSHMMSTFDAKGSSTTSSFSPAGSKKATSSHPLSLTQKVSAMQQDINKSRPPRTLKTPRIISTGLSGKMQSQGSSSSTSLSATSGSSSSSKLHAKTQKVPITITIPISRLPSSLQLTTSTSKTINVPALSAYLAQQKFVLSTGKPSNLDSRTVLLGSSSSSNKRIGGIMVSTNSTKGSTVFKTSSHKDGSSSASSNSKSAATITLHLPSQSNQKETSTSTKKAASDIKMVGVLNQKNKTSQLVSAASIKPSSLPSASPKFIATSSSSSPGELSPIQPRQKDDDGVDQTFKSAADDYIDDSDIDFSVIPTGRTSLLAQQSNHHLLQQRNIRTSFPLPSPAPSANTTCVVPTTTTFLTMPLTVNSKIIRVPVSSGSPGDRGRLYGSKNFAEFNKSKSENQLMNSAWGLRQVP